MMVFGKKKRLETPTERVLRKTPRSVSSPCSICFGELEKNAP